MATFEAHITLTKGYADKAIQVGADYGFHYSVIDGWDEVGGPRNAFLTKSSEDSVELSADVEIVASVLKQKKIPFKRIKLEQCLYDVRYNKEGIPLK